MQVSKKIWLQVVYFLICESVLALSIPYLSDPLAGATLSYCVKITKPTLP